MQQEDLERFWLHVDKSGDCWFWKCDGERGRFKVLGKNKTPVRVSFELAFGSIPSRANVLNNCGTPGCLRPSHLVLRKFDHPLVARSKRKIKKRETHRKYMRKRYKDDPIHREKHKVRVKLGKAVRQGKIKKRKCKKCGSPLSQAHHENYDEPFKVEWFCRNCHSEKHGKRNFRT